MPGKKAMPAGSSRLWPALAAALVAFAAGTPAYRALAQAAPSFDPAVVERGFNVWKDKVNCGSCHGWSGNGVPDDPRQPVGANLRETQLTHEQLVEVIKCGRPGTQMPHFDARAYKDDRCYGLTEAQLGDQKPPASEISLIAREIEAVATYIEATMKGRGPFTDEDCQAYFGAGAEACTVLMLNRGAAVPGAGAAGAHGP